MGRRRSRVDHEAAAVIAWLGATLAAFSLLAVIVERDVNADSTRMGFAVTAPDGDPTTDAPA